MFSFIVRVMRLDVCALHGVSLWDRWLCVLPRWLFNVNVFVCEGAGEAAKLAYRVVKGLGQTCTSPPCMCVCTCMWRLRSRMGVAEPEVMWREVCVCVCVWT